MKSLVMVVVMGLSLSLLMSRTAKAEYVLNDPNTRAELRAEVMDTLTKLGADINLYLRAPKDSVDETSYVQTIQSDCSKVESLALTLKNEKAGAPTIRAAAQGQEACQKYPALAKQTTSSVSASEVTAQLSF